MAVTYSQIATQTLGSNAATVTFSSIPGTYTDLVVIMSAKNTSSNNNGKFTLNNDTSSLYSNTYLYGNGSVAGSGRITNNSDFYTADISTSNYGSMSIHLMNYANTTTYKTVLLRGNDAGLNAAAWVGLYRSTSAITRIDISSYGGDLASGSTFSLYGILAA